MTIYMFYLHVGTVMATRAAFVWKVLTCPWKMVTGCVMEGLACNCIN